ncbi:hypothetical protein [Niveibacterium sp. COAC-50]|uniref:hypothetical protein n=1 Tax=Niveibacterium sp. COAC-50 TaxID=2729384 RepID=UPI001551E7A3|nr:hypothetical protein [Niveibacterium sp. COAC-50]
MNPTETLAPLQSLIREYFKGEYHEMLLIFAGSAALTCIAVWLWVATHSGFAVGFGVTVLATAMLLCGTAASLLVRDKGLVEELTLSIGTPQQSQVLAKERARIEVVVSKYRYYRYSAAVLAALSVLGLLLTSRGWVHGVVTGLLLLVVAQVVIDHFSEQRATQYLAALP